LHTASEIMGGLYIHIPFCVKKCVYCDFYSVTDLSGTVSFPASLEREMQLAGHTPLAFDTLYIGGGTPSVLGAAAIEQIIAAAFGNFKIRSDAEATIEVNPGTVTQDDLVRYRQAGGNRLNIGVQSFHEKNLRFLGRIHTAKEALSAFDRARRAGFDNVGLDLIYGLPEQDKGNWLDDLDRATRLNPEHLSCYMLTCETGTPLDRDVKSGRTQLPVDDTLRELFETTIEYLASHGFFHYEVSNFARITEDGRTPWMSRHNWKYWSLAPYIGLGPSAHSFIEPDRRWNHSSLEKYLQDIRAGKLPIADKEQLTREQMIMETIYLGFRTTAGVDLAKFQKRCSLNFLKYFEATISEFEKDDLLKVTKTHCALTRKGMILLDGITAVFTNQDVA
jgi:oxygen-independent coproporphyrinogen-3 oxidase